jgi:hypothetical protein
MQQNVKFIEALKDSIQTLSADPDQEARQRFLDVLEEDFKIEVDGAQTTVIDFLIDNLKQPEAGQISQYDINRITALKPGERYFMDQYIFDSLIVRPE